MFDLRCVCVCVCVLSWTSCVLVTGAGRSLVVVARVVALQGLVLSVAVAARCCHQDRWRLIYRQDKTRRDWMRPSDLYKQSFTEHYLASLRKKWK